MKSWNDIRVKRPAKDGLYEVAVVSESGRKIVCSAEYERSNGKDYWEIMSYEFDVLHGRILFWREMPDFPNMSAYEEEACAVCAG